MKSIEQIHEELILARQTSDFFGEFATEDDVKRIYREYSKIVHPDAVLPQDKYLASETFQMLNMMYMMAQDEIQNGIYAVKNPIMIYQTSKPLFEFEVDQKVYTFYENFFKGEVATIYKGVSENNFVFLKQANNPIDDDLIIHEYETLKKLRHIALPIVEAITTFNGRPAFVMREVKGIMLSKLVEDYARGIPEEHVMWMLERMLSIVGYLHKNFIIHGNIKPENILVNKETHNVSLVGYSLCITDARDSNAKYKIVNRFYTAPEVATFGKNAEVSPCSDIYSVGMIALKLLGGNVETKKMPATINSKIKEFVEKMINPSLDVRTDDAWKLWSELIKIRTEIFGTARFKKFE